MMRLVWNKNRVNPGLIERAVTLLKSHGISEIELLGTSSVEEACLAGRNCRGIERIILAGGDGSVHHLVNGVMTLPKRDRPCIGILPLGTGNDFARALYGDKVSLATALQRIVLGNAESIDLLRVNFGNGELKYAVNQVGIGFSPLVLRELEQSPLFGGLGSIKYGMAAAKVLMTRPIQFDTEISGDIEISSRFYSMINIANGAFEGGGFRTAPRAELTDHHFDITTIGSSSRFRLVQMFLKLLFDFPIDASLSSNYRGQYLELNSLNDLSVQIDGDLMSKEGFSTSHLEVSVEPGAVRFLR